MKKESEQLNTKKHNWDASTISLLVSNLIVILFAIIEKWDIRTIILIYLIQGLIITIFAIIKSLPKILFGIVKLYKNRGFKYTIAEIKLFIFIFIIFICPILMFMGILYGPDSFPDSSYKGFSVEMIIVTVIFFFNHLFSFFYNYKKDSENEDSNKMIFRRILFFWILIVISNFYLYIFYIVWTLIFGRESISIKNLLIVLTIIFLIVKTWLDVKLHIKEHRIEE